MNTLLYKCFLAVAEEKNISKAAARLFISQQTLSHHIAKLEEEYHTVLFERTKPLTLTYAGERMRILAQEVISLDRRMNNEMGEIVTEAAGELNIGSGRDRAYLLAPAISRFHDFFPHYQIHCTGGFNQQLVQMLIFNNIDMMISSTPQTMSDTESKYIMDDHLVLVVHKDLLAQYYQQPIFNDTIDKDFSFLNDLPLVVTGDRVKSRIMAETFFRENQLHPHIQTTIDYSEGLLSFVLTQSYGAICFKAPLINRLEALNPATRTQLRILRLGSLSKPVFVQATWLKENYHPTALVFLRQLICMPEVAQKSHEELSIVLNSIKTLVE